MKKLLIFLLVTPLLLIAAGGYVLLFTQAPYEWIQAGLADQGVNIIGMTGNMNEGIRVQKLVAMGDRSIVTIEGAEFKYTGLSDLLIKKEFIIENLEVKRLDVKILKTNPAQSAAPSDGTTQSTEPSPFAKAAQQARSGGLKRFEIKNLHFANVSYKDPGNPLPVEIKELKYNNVLITPTGFEGDLLSLQSNLYDLSVKGLKFADGEISHQDKITGVLKSVLSPRMKKDVAFTAVVSGKGMQTKVELSFFEDRVKLVKADSMDLKMEVKSFTPMEWFHTAVPLTDLEGMAIWNNPMTIMAGTFPFVGQFKMGSAVFQIGQNPAQSPPNQLSAIQAFAELNGVKYRFAFAPQLKPRTVETATSPTPNTQATAQADPLPAEWFALTSDKYSSTRDCIATLYFGKPYLKVAADQKPNVDYVTTSFGSGEIFATLNAQGQAIAQAQAGQTQSPGAVSAPQTTAGGMPMGTQAIPAMPNAGTPPAARMPASNR